MMILAPSPSSAESPSPVREEALEEFRTQQSRSEVFSQVEPSFGRSFSYAYDRGVVALEGGRILVRLRHPLKVTLDYTNHEAEVEGWGLRFPISETGSLPEKLSRRFLLLFSKADRDDLNEQEQGDWINVLDQTDFRKFCIDRAAPQYAEGRIVQRQPNFVRVEWHDGELGNIHFPAAAALNGLHKGDEFSAHVKFGQDMVPLSIERIAILSVGE